MPSIPVCDAWVRLSGNVKDVVIKRNVPLSELALIHAIHGEASVGAVQEVGSVQLSAREEKARLMERYGRREDAKKIVEALFPGFDPKLPTDLETLPLEEEGIVCLPPKFMLAAATAPVEEDLDADTLFAEG